MGDFNKSEKLPTWKPQLWSVHLWEMENTYQRRPKDPEQTHRDIQQMPTQSEIQARKPPMSVSNPRSIPDETPLFINVFIVKK